MKNRKLMWYKISLVAWTVALAVDILLGSPFITILMEICILALTWELIKVYGGSNAN